jgi:hypothetical protein
MGNFIVFSSYSKDMHTHILPHIECYNIQLYFSKKRFEVEKWDLPKSARKSRLRMVLIKKARTFLSASQKP